MQMYPEAINLTREQRATLAELDADAETWAPASDLSDYAVEVED